MATLGRTDRVKRRKQKVPNLLGLREADARLVLRHRGFYDPNLQGTPQADEPRVDVRYVKSYAPFGTVVDQSPTRGQIVDTDTTMSLNVSMESLLDYMPAIYQRKQAGAVNFLREFLWIFQHGFYAIESKIDILHTYYEVFETPKEFLPWLASWVAFSLDGKWSEDDRRLFLKRAVELYRIRGTRKGLETFIEIYMGVKPSIIENDWPLDGFQIGVTSTIGVESAILPPIDRAHSFIVEVPLDPDSLEDDQIIKLHQIISSEKPAHTNYYLRFTGKPKEERRWMGPIIGAYRVASTRDEMEVEASPVSEPDKAESVDAEVMSDLEKRLAAKREERARRRRRPAESEPQEDEKVERRRLLSRTDGKEAEESEEGQETGSEVLRRSRARRRSSDGGEEGGGTDSQDSSSSGDDQEKTDEEEVPSTSGEVSSRRRSRRDRKEGEEPEGSSE